MYKKMSNGLYEATPAKIEEINDRKKIPVIEEDLAMLAYENMTMQENYDFQMAELFYLTMTGGLE